MANPPPLSKRAFVSACILLEESSPLKWKGIRAGTMKGKSIPIIVDFNTGDVTDVIRKTFAIDYLSTPEYNEDNVKDISKYTENGKTGFDLWQVKSNTALDSGMITDDAAETKAAGEALWDITKDTEKKTRDEQEDVERDKAEAMASEKGNAEDDDDDNDVDSSDEDKKEEVKEDGESTYNVMFDPDTCGPGTRGPGAQKVHFIVEHKGENYLVKKDI